MQVVLKHFLKIFKAVKLTLRFASITVRRSAPCICAAEPVYSTMVTSVTESLSASIYLLQAL